MDVLFYFEPSGTELIDALNLLVETDSLKKSDIASKHQLTEAVMVFITN
jgi:hypothetical protein